MSAWLFDTETTGVGKNDQVIELAYSPFDFTPPHTPYEFVKRFGHSAPMSLGALATHHILPEELEDLSLFDRDEYGWPDYLIGHNIDFDWKMCRKPPVRRICTLALARKALPKLDSHSQTALMYFFEGPTRETAEKLRNAHSALHDVHNLRSVLHHLLYEYYPDVTSIEDLWAASEEARIPDVMPFGKFQGQPISSVDNGWRAWYRRQVEPNEYILQAFARFPYGA